MEENVFKRRHKGGLRELTYRPNMIFTNVKFSERAARVKLLYNSGKAVCFALLKRGQRKLLIIQALAFRDLVHLYD